MNEKKIKEIRKIFKTLFKDLIAIINLKFFSNFIHSFLNYDLIFINSFNLYRRGHIS